MAHLDDERRVRLYDAIDKAMRLHTEHEDDDRIESSAYVVVAFHEMEDAVAINQVRLINESDHENFESAAKAVKAEDFPEAMRLMGEQGLAAIAAKMLTSQVSELTDEVVEKAQELKYGSQFVLDIKENHPELLNKI